MKEPKDTANWIVHTVRAIAWLVMAGVLFWAYNLEAAELESMGASVTVTVQVTFVDPATINEGLTLGEPVTNLSGRQESEIIVDEETGVGVVTFK